MTMMRPDRRISRTRRQLRDALLGLIVEKGYDAVTVEDITQRADLGRTTFYLHFHDKEELLLKSLESVAEELKTQIGVAAWQETGGIDPARAILTVFQHAGENAALYRIILNGGAAIQAMDRLNSVVMQTAQVFFEMYEKARGNPFGVSPEVLAAYFSTSLLSFVTWWLRRGTPETPEEVSAIFTRLNFRGMVDVLGDPGGNVFRRTQVA